MMVSRLSVNPRWLMAFISGLNLHAHKGPKHQSGRVRPGEQDAYPTENAQLYAKNRHVKEMYFWTKVGAQKSVKYVSGGPY